SERERCGADKELPAFPTRRSSDLAGGSRDAHLPGESHQQSWSNGSAHRGKPKCTSCVCAIGFQPRTAKENLCCRCPRQVDGPGRSEEHTSELQSLRHLVCRLLLEK